MIRDSNELKRIENIYVVFICIYIHTNKRNLYIYYIYIYYSIIYIQI